jgi:hypothetical protein
MFFSANSAPSRFNLDNSNKFRTQPTGWKIDLIDIFSIIDSQQTFYHAKAQRIRKK